MWHVVPCTQTYFPNVPLAHRTNCHNCKSCCHLGAPSSTFSTALAYCSPPREYDAGVLRTKKGRLINGEEWLRAEKRLLARPVHPSVESYLHFKQVPVAKFEGIDDLEV